MTVVAKQRDLFTRRFRSVAPPDPSEVANHTSRWSRDCVGSFGEMCCGFMFRNGEERDKRTAAKLKAMGVLPGVADLVFVWHPTVWQTTVFSNNRKGVNILFLELKAPKRKPSDVQISFC